MIEENSPRRKKWEKKFSSHTKRLSWPAINSPSVSLIICRHRRGESPIVLCVVSSSFVKEDNNDKVKVFLWEGGFVLSTKEERRDDKGCTFPVPSPLYFLFMGMRGSLDFRSVKKMTEKEKENWMSDSHCVLRISTLLCRQEEKKSLLDSSSFTTFHFPLSLDSQIPNLSCLRCYCGVETDFSSHFP